VSSAGDSRGAPRSKLAAWSALGALVVVVAIRALLPDSGAPEAEATEVQLSESFVQLLVPAFGCALLTGGTAYRYGAVGVLAAPVILACAWLGFHLALGTAAEFLPLVPYPGFAFSQSAWTELRRQFDILTSILFMTLPVLGDLLLISLVGALNLFLMLAIASVAALGAAGLPVFVLERLRRRAEPPER